MDSVISGRLYIAGDASEAVQFEVDNRPGCIMILGIWYKLCDYTGRKIRVDFSKEGLRPKGELLALSRPVPPSRTDPF